MRLIRYRLRTLLIVLVDCAGLGPALLAGAGFFLKPPEQTLPDTHGFSDEVIVPANWADEVRRHNERNGN
jgi:hypothetical protein